MLDLVASGSSSPFGAWSRTGRRSTVGGVAGAVALVVLLVVGARAAARPRAGDGDSVSGIVARGVRRAYGALHGCFRTALAERRDASGTLFVEVTLGSRDAVSSAKVVRDELKRPAVSRCVARWLRGWTLPGAAAAGAGPGTRIVVPLTFRGDPHQFIVAAADVTPWPLDRGKSGHARVVLQRSNAGASRVSAVVLDLARPFELLATSADQVLFVLQGRVRLRSGGRSHRLRSRDAVWIPPGVSVRLTAVRRLRLLQMFVPGGAERRYRPSGPGGRDAGGITSGGSPSRGAAGRRGSVGKRRSVMVVRSSRVARRPLASKRGSVRPLLLPKRLGHRRFALGLIALPVGTQLRERAHLGSAEVLYAIDGDLVLRLDGHRREQTRDAAAYLPHSQAHAISARSQAVMLQLFVPAGPDRDLWRGGRRAPQRAK